jgi:hypothetical protein
LLQDLDIETNTLVVFTSDNGPTIEDALHLKQKYAANFFDNFGPMDGIKRDSFEGGIRMPTLVRWPGHVAAGSANLAPSQFQDWMPTLAGLAGLPAPARTDGVSLVPTLTGSGAQHPSTVYIECFDPSTTPNYQEFEPSHRNRKRNQMQVIGLDGYQGVRYDITSQTDNFEIYDVLHDAKEATNLALQPGFAALQQEMKNRVLQLRRPNDSAPRPYDDESVPPSAPVSARSGEVAYSVYDGIWPWVPDVAMLTNVASGHCAGLDPAIGPRQENYAIDYRGHILIPANGNYTFYLNDDGGAVFRLHEATVIDDDFSHSKKEASGSILLQAGLHAFHLTCVHLSGPRVLSLKYAADGQAKQDVPLSAFYSDCPGSPIPRIVNNASAPAQSVSPAWPRAPGNLPLIAWNPARTVGKWSLLIHAVAVRLAVSGNWLHNSHVSDDLEWHPLSCSFPDDGRRFCAGPFFEGVVENAQIYQRNIGASEMPALFGHADPSARDWQRHYFESTPDDWMADEDGDGAPLWRGSPRSNEVFIADSPAKQWVPEITAEHPVIRFYSRIIGAHRINWQIQTSSDLFHWTNLASDEVSAKPSPDLPGFEEVTFRVAGLKPGGGRLYARVQSP